MRKRMSVLAAIAAAMLAGTPALAQGSRFTAIDSPRAPAEPLGLLGGDAEASNWIGSPVHTETGTIQIWVWLFTPSLLVDGAVQRVGFHNEIDCDTGRFRQIGHEIYHDATFERGHLIDQDFREPIPLLQEYQLVPYVCAGRTPEVRVANPDAAQAHFRR